MRRLIAMIVMLWPLGGLAEEGPLRVHAPPALEDAGLVQHILPRFALKYGLRATLAEEAEAEVHFGDVGTPVFVGLGQVWHLSHQGTETAQKFEAWLRSDIGRRTVDGFAPEGDAPFTSQIAVKAPPRVATFDGDPVAGERLSLELCGRCHVINDSNRMKGMGATPSFGVLRTFADWENRFSTFYVLNPHPSFTQIDDVTPAFDPAHPPPIVPVRMALEDLDAILAYVATIAPADLGAPIQSQ